MRSPELLARWADVAAFGFTMRTHEGNRSGENLQADSDEEARSTFARMTQLFAALSESCARSWQRRRRPGFPRSGTAG